MPFHTDQMVERKETMECEHLRGGMEMTIGSKRVLSVRVRSPWCPRFRRLEASVQGRETDVQAPRQREEEVENRAAGHPSGETEPFMTSPMSATASQPKCGREVRSEQQAKQSRGPIVERTMEMREERWMLTRERSVFLFIIPVASGSCSTPLWLKTRWRATSTQTST